MSKTLCLLRVLKKWPYYEYPGQKMEEHIRLVTQDGYFNMARHHQCYDKLEVLATFVLDRISKEVLDELNKIYQNDEYRYFV
jgi:hypothetical protein